MVGKRVWPIRYKWVTLRVGEDGRYELVVIFGLVDDPGRDLELPLTPAIANGMISAIVNAAGRAKKNNGV